MQSKNSVTGFWASLFGSAPVTSMSRLCEIVYPMMSGIELKFSEMTAAQKYQCMLATMQILTIFLNVTLNADADGVADAFYDFGDQFISYTKIPTEHGYWKPEVLLKVPGMHEHFILNVLAELKVAPSSREAIRIEAICYRFAELYGSKLAIHLEDIVTIARKVKHYMSEKNLLGQWDRLLPSLLECNADVFNVFWREDYEPEKFVTESRKQLLNYAVAAGILEPSMLPRQSLGVSPLEESEDPSNAKPPVKPKVTYYEVPILPPAQTKIYPDPTLPAEARVGGIAAPMHLPAAHGAGAAACNDVRLA